MKYLILILVFTLNMNGQSISLMKKISKKDDVIKTADKSKFIDKIDLGITQRYNLPFYLLFYDLKKDGISFLYANEIDEVPTLDVVFEPIYSLKEGYKFIIVKKEYAQRLLTSLKIHCNENLNNYSNKYEYVCFADSEKGISHVYLLNYKDTKILKIIENYQKMDTNNEVYFTEIFNIVFAKFIK